MIAILLMYAISATTFIISKLLLTYSTPLVLSGLRTAIAGTLFLGYCAFKKQKYHLKDSLIPCLIVGLFSFVLSNTLKFWAMCYLTSHKAALIATVEPVFTLLFASWLCNERVTAYRLFAMFICMAGGSIGIISGFYQPFDFCLSEFVLLFSVISSSFGALLMRKLIHEYNYSAPMVNGISMMSAGLTALTMACFLESSALSFSQGSLPIFMLLLGTMILISNVGGYGLYGWILTRYSALLISCAALLRPFFVAIYSGNTSGQTLLSAIIIVVGISLIYYEERRQSYILKQIES